MSNNAKEVSLSPKFARRVISSICVIGPDRTGDFHSAYEHVSLAPGAVTNLSAPFVLISSQWNVPATAVSVGMRLTLVAHWEDEPVNSGLYPLRSSLPATLSLP